MKPLLTLSLMASLVGCSVQNSAPAIGTAQQPIIGGTDDTGDPGVMLLVAIAGGGISLCTAELVSPHVLITAAHCVTPSLVGTGATYQVYTGSHIDARGQGDGVFLTVKETHPNPDFDPNNVGSGSDIGVVILTDPSTVTPLPMNRMAMDMTLNGQPVRFVGYGKSSGTDTAGTTAGTKRQVSSTLTNVIGGLLEFDDAAHGTCEGDSGGPAFMKLDGTNEVIVGLTSFGTHQDCTPPGFDTELDLYMDFVDPFIMANDPPPVDMAQLPPGVFAPGSVGAMCSDDSQCTGGICAQPNNNGFCTAGCDPSDSSSCPTGTHCGSYGNQSICLPDGRSFGGCAMGGAGGGSGLLFAFAGFAVAIALVLRRRRAG